jgi:protein-disulfide isomerase-like protein with CxxC motif
MRLEHQQRELPGITAAVAELARGGAMSDIRAPVLPDFRRSAWVSRLAVLPLGQALTEIACVEKEVRDFLADSIDLVRARLEVSRDICTQLENKALEQSWDQLRAHARAHYVEERDVDDVLAMLSQRYVSAGLARRQKELSLNPFNTER